VGPTGQRGTDDARGRGALAGGPGDATRDEAVRAGAHAGLRRASWAERGEGAGLRGREGARGEWAERRERTGPAGRKREESWARGGRGRSGPRKGLGRGFELGLGCFGLVFKFGVLGRVARVWVGLTCLSWVFPNFKPTQT